LLPGKRQKRRRNALKKKTIEDIQVRNALKEIIRFETDFVLPIVENNESENRRLSSPDEERSQTDDYPDGDGNDKDEGIEVDIDTEYSAEGMPMPDLKQSELILLIAVTSLAGHSHKADCQETVTVNGFVMPVICMEML
jgi:hypothetical protein